MFIIVGIILGFVAAIPLGPVNAFVISQSMKRNFFHGFLAGVTAAILDFSYCLIALLGLSLITENIARYQVPLKIIFGAVMLAVAWRLYRQSKKPVPPREGKVATSFTPKPIFGVILLYVSNPSLYIFWIWAAGWAASHGWILNYDAAPYLFAVSCGLGGLIWYTVMAYYVAKYHHQFSPRMFQRIFFVLAVFLAGFALYTFAGIFIDF
ncbi:MAG: LysE family translocator [Candidatus Aminicenantales bacterium]